MPAAQCVNAQEAGPTEYQIKAAFLYNFAKFVEWPADTGTLNLCILGEDRFGRDIDTIEGKKAADKSLMVMRIKSAREIKKCRILFISSWESGQLADILMTARDLKILTVGDTDGFAERGVIINFYGEQNKIRFEINRDAAERSGLKISSKLFGLARIVHDIRQGKTD